MNIKGISIFLGLIIVISLVLVLLATTVIFDYFSIPDERVPAGAKFVFRENIE